MDKTHGNMGIIGLDINSSDDLSFELEIPLEESVVIKFSIEAMMRGKYIPYKDEKKLSEKDLCRLDAAIYIVGWEVTLREAGALYDIPFTTLDRWIHEKLPGISNKLYLEVVDQFFKNIYEQGMKDKNKKRREKI